MKYQNQGAVSTSWLLQPQALHVARAAVVHDVLPPGGSGDDISKWPLQGKLVYLRNQMNKTLEKRDTWNSLKKPWILVFHCYYTTWPKIQTSYQFVQWRCHHGTWLTINQQASLALKVQCNARSIPLEEPGKNGKWIFQDVGNHY